MSSEFLNGNFRGGLGVPEHLLSGKESERTLSSNPDERQMQLVTDPGRRRAHEILTPAEGEGEG